MRLLTLILAAMFAVSIGLLTWTTMDLLSNQQSAMDAGTNLDQCQLLARQIEVLQQSPTQASQRAMSSTEVTKLIQEAVAKAQIPPNSVISIAPLPPEREGKTDYQRYSTEVHLAPLTWREIEGVFQAITTRDASLVIAQLRFSGSPSAGGSGLPADGPEKWGVQLRLTQSVFAPITKSSP